MIYHESKTFWSCSVAILWNKNELEQTGCAVSKRSQSSHDKMFIHKEYKILSFLGRIESTYARR